METASGNLRAVIRLLAQTTATRLDLAALRGLRVRNGETLDYILRELRRETFRLKESGDGRKPAIESVKTKDANDVD